MDRPLVAVIPGDDAAPEAMAAAMTVLRHLDPAVDWDELPPGAELAAIEPTEREATVHARIDAADTVLFGSTNGTTPGVAYMRWGRRTFANVRPIRWRPGYRSPMAAPEGIDYVIVRENLEDAYVGIMGDAADLLRRAWSGPRARLVTKARAGSRPRSSPGPAPSRWPGSPSSWPGAGASTAIRASSRCRPRPTCCR